MNYTLVRPDGEIARTVDFAAPPPFISPVKGRWLPNNPPAINFETHELSITAPVPADAVEIPYVVSLRPVGQARKAKIAQLKLDRTAAIEADVVVGTRTWPSDEAFKRRLSTIIARMGRGKPAPAKLRGVDGPAINTPTVAQLENIEDAIAAQEDAAWVRYEDLVDDVKAAANALEVAAVIW